MTVGRIPPPAATGSRRVRAPQRSARRADRAAGVVLALLLLVHPLTAATAGASPLRGLQERLGQAQQRLQQLTGQRQAQESVVDRLRGRTQGFAVELGRVEEALFATINRLVQAEAELDQVEQDLAQLEAQIVEKQAAVDARSGVYTTRLRAMYKFTRTSPLEQLLGARDFSEVLQRVTMMQAFTRVDNLLLGQLRTEQADLLRAKEELQRKQAQAQALRDEIDQQRVNLALQRTQQATLLEAARLDQGAAELVLSEYDQQARTEQASIASLQVQYQKELEEQERRRLEEQRRQEELRRQQALSQSATATAQAQNQVQQRVQQTAQAVQAVQAAQTAQAGQAAQATQAAQAARAGTATAQAAATRQAQPAASSTAAPRSSPTAQPAAATPRPAPSATPAQRAPAAQVPPATQRPSGPPVYGSVNTTTGPTVDGFSWPVNSPIVTTEFGDKSPFQASHTGIDLATAMYTPVRAAADGIVIESGLAVAGKPSLSYGMRVSIAHKGGVATLYAHLDDEKLKPTVKSGDRVERGQVIGYIGMTGLTTGPHVHFEVLIGGEPRNPRNYLPK